MSKRVLYTITSYLPAIGGAQIHFHELAKRILLDNHVQVVSHWDESRRGWLRDTTIFAPAKSKDYVIDRVPVHRIGFDFFDKLKMLPWFLSYYTLLNHAIDAISDIIEKKLAAIDSSWDLIHSGRIGREGLSYASWKLAKRLGVPFVFTPFHHPRWVGYPYQPFIDLCKKAEAVVALTEAEKREMIRLGVQDQRIHVLGTGPLLASSWNAADFKEKYGLNQAETIVLFVGQKYPYKGCRLLLEAAKNVWKKFPRTFFLFIGPKTRYSEKLFSRIKDHRIVELGSVDLETKTSAFAACDIFCLPSSQESFAAVFLEAWFFTKPVIGLKIPSVAEIVRHEQNGLLSENDVPSISGHIQSLISDKKSAQSLGQAGKQIVSEYDWNLLTTKLSEVYRSVLK